LDLESKNARFFPALFYVSDAILETTPFGVSLELPDKWLWGETTSLLLSPKLFDFDHVRLFEAVEAHSDPIKMKRK